MPKNFVELKTAIGDWLATDETRLPSSVRGDILNMCMREFLRKYETRFGEQTEVFQTRKQIRDYLLFDGWSKPRTAWYINPDNNKVIWLTYKIKDEFDRAFPVSGLFGFPSPMGAGTFGEDDVGMPEIYTVYGPYISLGKVPNSVFTVFVNYWRLLPDLTDAAPENDFTKHAWEYLLFSALVKSTKYGIEDDRIALWQQEAKVIEDDLIREHMRAGSVPRRVVESEEPG